MIDAGRRLTLALLVSAALHASLIFGVAVRQPSTTADAAPILARLRELPDAAFRASPPREAPERAPAPMREPPRPKEESAAAGAARAEPVRQAAPAPAAALPPVEMPLIADPTWYPAAQLDVFPAALEPIRPAYPPAAARADIAGQVTLLLLIDETGRVHESAVVDAQPQGTFDAAALEAFRAARFSPAQRDGRSVRSRVLVKVAFDPVGAAAAATP